MEFVQKIFSWNWFIWFHKFFGLDFFKFSGPLWNRTTYSSTWNQFDQQSQSYFPKILELWVCFFDFPLCCPRPDLLVFPISKGWMVVRYLIIQILWTLLDGMEVFWAIFGPIPFWQNCLPCFDSWQNCLPSAFQAWNFYCWWMILIELGLLLLGQYCCYYTVS